jgi:hypothetical protein
MSTETTNSQPSVEQMMAERTRDAGAWSPPSSFDLSQDKDRRDLQYTMKSGGVDAVIDNVQLIADDLFDMRYPDKKDDTPLRNTFINDITEKGAKFGRWFLFPWSKKLVRYPERDEHRALHTSRNRNLITNEEQQLLYDSTIAVFGLSVGSNVVEKMLLSGTGGKIILADMDVVEPSNLNRINGIFSDVGVKKIDLMARKISEVDPYIQQVHLREGVAAGDLEDLSANHTPDIIVDEVDNLAIKAAIRVFAKREGIPVLMATDVGDRSILDVERYDIQDVDPFNGRLKKAAIDELLDGELTAQRRAEFMLKIVGIRNVTPRLIDSVLQVDKTLPGLPQLGVTASIGGALASLAAREIILDRKLSSGRYICSPSSMLGLAPQTGRIEGLKTFLQVVKAKNKQ